MKKLVLFPILLMFLSVSAWAQEQKPDKATLKEWKTKKKSMSVEEFMQTMQDYEKVSGEKSSLTRQQKDINNQIIKLDEEIARLKEQLASMKSSSSSESSENSSSTGSEDFTKGEVYKVQVGAIRDANLEKFISHPRFQSETDADGKKKYTIACFRDYQMADNFKKFLISLGVKDAYWIKYVDNKRADINSITNGNE